MLGIVVAGRCLHHADGSWVAAAAVDNAPASSPARLGLSKHAGSIGVAVALIDVSRFGRSGRLVVVVFTVVVVVMVVAFLAVPSTLGGAPALVVACAGFDWGGVASVVDAVQPL